MRSDNLLRVSCGGVELDSPIVVASGVWPFEKDFWQRDSFPGLGGICTKAVTLNRREGNPGTRIWETPAGLLNSIGLQNRGVEHFLERDLPVISEGGIPFIVNVAMENHDETSEVLRRLEDMRNMIPAVELNISCPNVSDGGMAWGRFAETSAQAVSMARKKWKGPLWVKLTPQAEDIAQVARAVEEEGADALVVGNTWLGMAIDIDTARPVFERAFAGLSGPGIFPLALRMVWEVCSAVTIPVIGCGGVTSYRDCLAMLMAGATAVEVGTVMFLDLQSGKSFSSGLEEYLLARGLDGMKDIIGKARQ
ncbi:MAG: dihydroorotate dehydrogenase [Synergistales bacterium]|nr:dihydroorotate dehydrogenase [Synergistales bacterium]